MLGSLRLPLALTLLGVWSLQLSAAENEPSTGELEKLIKQLDADQFAERQAASDELSRLGSSAFPALEQAAKSDSREASQRAIEILKKHYEGDDTPTKQAARGVLARLAADGSTRSGRQADEALNPPLPPQFGRTVIGQPAVRVARANIRIQAPPARFVKRMHVKNNNGVKEIEVEENGRKVKVVEDPKEGIQLEVTQKKNGKETTEKYSAKNAEELKQKHPEARKIYDEVNKPNGIQLQVGGAQLPIAPAQAVPGAPIPVDDAKTKGMRLEAMKRSLQNIDRQVEQLRRAFPDRPDVERHIERLEAHRKQVEKLETELQKDAE